ncbi:hypothetical protein [uncultured Rhodospira sp.]|uniref:hypothetical protein n=1 Tax=uncultured Rhodospira sp. TaxID=1936189 RepID=UPI00262D7759|nr:hypothetical protein [uncultured Rhodospira sp.]
MKRTVTTMAVAMATTAALSGAALAQGLAYPRDATVNGRVTAVNEEAGTFTVAARHGPVTVHINRLGDNPIDDVGRVQIERNDLVSASGMLDLAEEDRTERTMQAGTVSVHIDSSAAPSH